MKVKARLMTIVLFGSNSHISKKEKTPAPLTAIENGFRV
jgi:hypothetical protein